MKNQNLVASGYVMATVCLMLNFFSLHAQVQTARFQSIIPNSNAFYEYLPQGYSTETQTYPLLVFLHGVGELGYGSVSTLPIVLRNGPPKLINDGTFPVSFAVNGQVFKFIVISPQFISWPTAVDVQACIDYAVRTYRVNTNRIYLTGLSMGGGVVWDYGSYTAAYANRIAALLAVSGASSTTPAKSQVIASANLPVWATHNQNDPTVPVTNTTGFVDAINSSSPPPSILAKKTIFAVSGHDAWSTTYSPNFRENNLNVYEWLLQYQRNITPQVNQLPVSNAGADVTITLPANSVTLAGTGTDADGTVAGYSWSKISGPSQFTFSSNNISNPVFSNLAAGDYTLRLTVADNTGAASYDDILIRVNAAPASYIALPSRIEAENYSLMSGVQAETTADAGGGKNVGFIDTGDWMDYNVSVPTAGTFTANFRVASPYTAQQLLVKNSSGTIISTVSIPQTGAFQNWTTVTTTLTLPAGNQTLRISSGNGGWNFNWLELLTAVQTITANTIPGRIEAENYDAMSGVLTENTLDVGAGKNVGFIDTGDWMDYNATVPAAGTYTVNFRVASPNTAQQLQLKNSSGTVLATVIVPQTGAFQAWTTVTATITLPAGSQTLRVYSANGGWNINWLEFISAIPTTTGVTLPAKIEAENYDTANGILTETTLDIGAGKNVGWIDTGDWLDYKVSVATAATYTVNFRIASPYTAQQLQFKNSSGSILATVNIPQTGGFQTWATVSATVTLPAGNQTLRLYSANGGWNINWLEFISGTPTPTGAPIPGKIEAENYNAMIGISTENTTDVGGGKNVGWISTGAWMDYDAYVSAAGSYTVNFRLAAPSAGQQLQLKNSSGTVLATITIPQTGGYQVWTTASATVNLAAGNQTLRIYSLNGSWNINWVEFVSSGTVVGASIILPGLRSSEIPEQDRAGLDKVGITIYPNPVKDNFSMQLNSSKLGVVTVSITDQTGKIIKTYRLLKDLPISRFHIPVNGLIPGIYFIEVQMGNYTESKKMLKVQ